MIIFIILDDTIYYIILSGEISRNLLIRGYTLKNEKDRPFGTAFYAGHTGLEPVALGFGDVKNKSLLQLTGVSQY